MRKVLIAVGLILVGVLVWVASRPVETAAPTAEPPALEAAPEPDKTRRPRHPRKPEAAKPLEPEPTAPEPSFETVPSDEASGTVKVVDFDKDEPVAGIDVHFLAFDPEGPEFLEDAPDDPYAHVIDTGRTLRTDDQGFVALPRFPKSAVVCVQSRGLRGMAVFEWEGAGSDKGWVLNLAPMITIRVRVLDGSGDALRGMEVALMSKSDWGDYEVESAETAAETGVATLETVLYGPEPGESDPVFHVTVKGAFDDRPRVTVDLESPPEDPIDLVLARTGTVVISIADAALTGLVATVAVAQDAPDHPMGHLADGRSSSHPVAQGTALFVVGLGGELDVTVTDTSGARTTVRKRILGPTEPGQEVRVDLEAGPLRPVLHGRLVDEAGAPVPQEPILAEVLEPGDASGDFAIRMPGSTDAEGRFEFAVNLSPGRTDGAKLRLGRKVSHGEGSFTTRTIATLDLPELLGPGRTDLGDVVFTGETVLLTGRVVFPDGTPAVGATVGAMEHSHGMRSPEDEVESVVADDEGRFELKGSIESEMVALGVALDDYYVDKDPRFAKGSTDVTVMLSQAGGLAGSVLVPEGVDPWLVSVHVHGEAQRNFDTDYRFSREGLNLRPDENGRFEIRTLRPGTADLSIRLGHNADDEVFRLEGLVITAGQVNRDPRLVDIDLTKDTREIHVRVTDRDGAPIADARFHHRKHGSDEWWDDEEIGPEGTAAIRVKAGELDVMVTAKGYRSVRRDRVGQDVQITLEPVPVTKVIVRLKDGATLPAPPYELEVELEWVGPVNSELSGEHRFGDPRNPTRRARDARIGTSREVTVDAWEPGRYRVTLTLWKMHMSGGGGGGIATVPEEVTFTLRGDGAPVTVELAMDEDEYRRELESDEE